jgi:hypothetical protein
VGHVGHLPLLDTSATTLSPGSGVQLILIRFEPRTSVPCNLFRIGTPSGVYLFFPLTILCIIMVLPANMTSDGIDVILAQQVCA